MPARLSIIIPTRNAAGELPATLMSLMPGVEAGIIRELIVVDAGSTDATTLIAEDAGAIVLTTTPSRGGQLRAGAGAARGDWLFFLHADTHLPDDWTTSITQRYSTPDRAACFQLAFRADGFGARWTAGWANLRTRLLGLPYGDQGLLIHRDLYANIGGYPDQPLMEDVEIAKSLRGRIDMLPQVVRTGADKYVAEGWFRRGAKNLSFLIRYKFGAGAKGLARQYQPPEN